jgi:hypothetical protein
MFPSVPAGCSASAHSAALTHALCRCQADAGEQYCRRKQELSIPRVHLNLLFGVSRANLSDGIKLQARMSESGKSYEDKRMFISTYSPA